MGEEDEEEEGELLTGVLSFVSLFEDEVSLATWNNAFLMPQWQRAARES